MFDPQTYATLDRLGTWVLAWIAVFSVWTLGKTFLRIGGRKVRMSRHVILGELPGIPLMLLHTVGFVLSLLAGDWWSALLFAWWGPGYLFVATMVLRRGDRIDWRPWGLLTSWGCKLSCLVLMLLFGWLGLWTLPFAFSLWIMTDQVRLAWFEGNADRTRRTTEDFWLPRLLYPGLLLLPWFVAVPGGVAAAALGVLVLLAWVAGILHTVRAGSFRRRPDPTLSDNLRDIVYLPRRGAGPATDQGADALAPGGDR